MSMYNLLFGKNKNSEALLAMLELTPADVGRFRDAWVENDKIAVYTRNGGDNRECWELWNDVAEDTADSENCHCFGCIMSYDLPKHPNYAYDEDDDFDSTYATVYFNFPENYAKVLENFEKSPSGDERWRLLFEALK